MLLTLAFLWLTWPLKILGEITGNITDIDLIDNNIQRRWEAVKGDDFAPWNLRMITASGKLPIPVANGANTRGLSGCI